MTPVLVTPIKGKINKEMTRTISRGNSYFGSLFQSVWTDHGGEGMIRGLLNCSGILWQRLFMAAESKLELGEGVSFKRLPTVIHFHQGKPTS